EQSATKQEAGCEHPVTKLQLKSGSARAELSAPMTLPVPESFSVSAGNAAAINLIYELSAESGGEVSCVYKKASSKEFRLESCERELDASSWVEAKAVRLATEDSAARAAVTLCPVGPAFVIPTE